MLQVAPSDFDFIQVEEPNYGMQNDFGFPIVSVDELDLEENFKKMPLGRRVFYTRHSH